MGVLDACVPKDVFSYFEQLNAVPRGSGDTDRVSGFVKQFAIDRGLDYVQDALGNVIIYKPGTAGYEQAPTVILQAHLDMVCEAEEGVVHDFTREGLELLVEGDFVRANGTTLGGDDGIGVAYCMAILAANDLAHPPLEVVLTVDEEIGLLGAQGLDGTLLKGRTMINLDSEEEDIFLVSSAGGCTAKCTFALMRDSVRTPFAYTLRVAGLKGGHSGTEIHKELANADKTIVRVVRTLKEKLALRVCSVTGGRKDNAIPWMATAVLASDTECLDDLSNGVATMQEILRKELQVSDPDITLTVEPEEAQFSPLVPDCEAKILDFLEFCPNGVQHWNLAIPDLVETSLNLGILTMEEREMVAEFCLRSSVISRKEALQQMLGRMVKSFGGTIEIFGENPAWEYAPTSRIRDTYVACYRALYGKEPKVQAVHAGLECGLFAEKLPGLDCISVGPDIFDIHTAKERLSISSAKRSYELLLAVLAALKE